MGSGGGIASKAAPGGVLSLGCPTVLKGSVHPTGRVEAAFAAGLRSESLLEAGPEPEAAPSVGLQNTCWVGVQSTEHIWWTARRSTRS